MFGERFGLLGHLCCAFELVQTERRDVDVSLDGHYYILVQEYVVASAHCLKGLFKQIACCGVSEVGKTLVTAECYEVEMISSLFCYRTRPFVMADTLLLTSQMRDLGHPTPASQIEQVTGDEEACQRNHYLVSPPTF